MSQANNNSNNEEIDLPPTVLARVEELKKLHEDVDKINEAYKLERIQLEAKFREQRNVVFESRHKIVNGSVEAPGNDKGIPNFWLVAFGNHPAIADIIQEEDIAALHFLDDVRVSYNEDYTTFELAFHFKENPFFNNKILTKKYTLNPSLLNDCFPSLTDSEGTEIEWKAGRNLCVVEVKKKQKAKSGKKKGETRTIVKEVPRPSFFHSFGQPKEDDEEEEEEGEQEEERERIQLTEEEDFDIAHIIRTTIVPDAVLWFTGEAHADEYGNCDRTALPLLVTPENARGIFMSAATAFSSSFDEIEFERSRQRLLEILQNNNSNVRDALTTCLHEHAVVLAFTNASACGALDLLQAFFDIGMNVDVKNRDGNTALLDACYYEKEESVRWLLEHNANVDVQGKDGATPLMWACAEKGLATVKMLLSNSANVDIRNKFGWTALMIASARGDKETVQLLLNHNADFNLINNKGNTTLDLAKNEETKQLLQNYYSSSYVLK